MILIIGTSSLAAIVAAGMVVGILFLAAVAFSYTRQK